VDEHKFKSLDEYKHEYEKLQRKFDEFQIGPAASDVWSSFLRRREADLYRIGMQNDLDKAEVELAETQRLLKESEKARQKEQKEAAEKAKRVDEDMERLRREAVALEKRIADDRAEFEKARRELSQHSGDEGGTIILLMGHGGMGMPMGMPIGLPMGMPMGMPMGGFPMGGGFGGCHDPWAGDDSWI